MRQAQRCATRGLMLVLAAACLAAPAHALLELRHAHGLGYSADGSRILIPNHSGIAVYSEGRWSKAPGLAHDYMGFAVTRESIYSSGHVAGSRGRTHPLGLMRSSDGGRSWTVLGFEGEVEFHLVAAGYFSDALYIHAAEPNPVMERAGIYRRIGERLVGWRRAAGQGLEGELGMLAVHPTEAATLAAATTGGLFLSRDGGEAFRPLVSGTRVTAARYTFAGDALLVGTWDGKQAGLFRVASDDGAREALTLPPFGRDAVANIAQNPARPSELALISFERAVYVSPDAGKTWRRIARPRGTLPGS